MSIDPTTISYRQLRGYLSDMDRAGYTRTTINRRLSSLRSYFKWMDKVGKNTNNSAAVMQGPKLNKTLPAVVRSRDIDNLFAICEKDIADAKKLTMDKDNNGAKSRQKLAQAKRDYAIIELMYATGGRISEIAELTLSHIDSHSNCVKFLGKGNKERIVPLYNLATTALNDYIENHRDILLQNKSSKNSGGTNGISSAVFISNTGKNYSADSIRRMFRDKCNRAGVSENIHPHSMRHTFATDVLDGGADLRSVQEMLGHSSLSTTQIYTHLSTKKLSDVHSQAHPRG